MNEQRSIDDITDDLGKAQAELREVRAYLAKVPSVYKREEHLAGSPFSQGSGKISQLKGELALAELTLAQQSMKKIVWHRKPWGHDHVFTKKTAKRIYYQTIGSDREGFTDINGVGSGCIINMEATFGNDN